MKEEVYDIGGMHCAACSSSIERVTRKLPGVERSDVNLPMNRLTISYDENQVTPETIITKVEKAGFTAALKGEDKTIKKSADKPQSELSSQKYEFIVMAVLSVLLLYVSMGPMLFANTPLPELISMHSHPMNYALTQLLLTVPIMFLGKRFFVSGFKSLFNGSPNMDALVAISCTASFVFSVVMMYLISDDPHNVHGLYFESAAVVLTLISLGKHLEGRSQEKTKDAITKLIELSPETALLVLEESQWEVPTDTLKVGDVVLVKAGMKFPLDGVVVKGEAAADEAMLTGESLPVEKTENSSVIGGSISVSGAVYVRITKVGQDTILAKIIKFVEDAQGKKAPISKIADKVAGVFVPVVIAIAVLAAAIWLIFGEDLSFALKVFTTVLVIACPCAMGLATPTAIIVGTGLGASRGILIRSGEALQRVQEIDVIMLDKTGTVTLGKPQVTDIIALSVNEDELLRIAATAEQLSDHPLAKAICQAAKERGLTQDLVQDDFENLSGMGLKLKYEGKTLLVGNSRLMDENKISLGTVEADMNRLSQEGKTPMLIALGGELLGVISVSDTIKESSIQAIESMHKLGIETVLLTGDNQKAAEYIGGIVGTDRVIAGVLPQDKAQVIADYQAKGKKVMMVGDGINDAPALAAADVGCAIGSGSDIAIESASIVLMKSDLRDVAKAISLSRLTIRNIKQNLFWAFCYNVLGIPIAAGVLYPGLGLLLSPMIGGLAMSLSSIFVVANALRLRTKKL